MDDLTEFEGKIEALLTWITTQSPEHQRIFSYFYNALLKLKISKKLSFVTPKTLVWTLKELAYDKRNDKLDDALAEAVLNNVEAAMNMYGRFDVDALVANNASIKASWGFGLPLFQCISTTRPDGGGLGFQYSYYYSQPDAHCAIVESFVAMCKHRG